MVADPLVIVFIVPFFADSTSSRNYVLRLLKWVRVTAGVIEGLTSNVLPGRLWFRGVAQVLHDISRLSDGSNSHGIPDKRHGETTRRKVQSGIIARAPGTLTRSLTLANFWSSDRVSLWRPRDSLHTCQSVLLGLVS